MVGEPLFFDAADRMAIGAKLGEKMDIGSKLRVGRYDSCPAIMSINLVAKIMYECYNYINSKANNIKHIRRSAMPQDSFSKDIVFLDTEIDPDTQKVLDIGAIRTSRPVQNVSGRQLHTNHMGELGRFLQGTFFLCGHNIISFDLKYIFPTIEAAGIRSFIDTLYLSPLLFPKKPYHKLLKDDKIQAEEMNNPLHDARKSMELFMDEVSAFQRLDGSVQQIFYALLGKDSRFRGFFRYLDYNIKPASLPALIHKTYQNKLCANADIAALAAGHPVELAYCLAVIATEDRESIIPYWVQKKYPLTQQVYRLLCGHPCTEGCAYCRKAFDIHDQLKKKFGYDGFRSYDGEPLQEKAVNAAVHGKSLLAVFPTGGGKSITFQLPALMEAETVHGLTVVISPLQSLMKDQVDNLNQRGITDAVTINGLLNPIERSEALQRVENGIASLLYISPESLRSKTIERLLIARTVTRFVIDEAHCFSAWGQDFRVDYLYIGDFIAAIQEQKHVKIPVSCFTATAKQKVISDIREYFHQKLQINLELYTTNAARHNLRYEVLYRENDNEKYATLRSLIEQKNCSTIVYASRTRRTEELAEKLSQDGFNAKAFHGKMSSEEKIANQDAFIRGEVQIIVATSAFGMGVDKKDVKLVVHYNISDSLENYVQEAGRAGRDEHIEAECYILFNESDLDKHFMLLNQTKLSISEIQQVWRGIKRLTKNRPHTCCSALEIARQSGWNENTPDLETKVKTAVSALGTAGYIERRQNCPRVYADSIQVKNMREASARIDHSDKFDDRQKEYAKRIIAKLISTRSRSRSSSNSKSSSDSSNFGDAECRVDYIADYLGIEKALVIESVNLMREEGILANEKEMSVYVEAAALKARTKNTSLSKFSELEHFLLEHFLTGKPMGEGQRIVYKEVNEEALNKGIKFSSVSYIKILLHFWIIKGYIQKPEGEINAFMQIVPLEDFENLKGRFEKRIRLSHFIEQFFLDRAKKEIMQTVTDHSGPAHPAESTALDTTTGKDTVMIHFSVQELQKAYDDVPKFIPERDVTLSEIEEALLYLSKTGSFRLEGGFLVLYNAMKIERLEKSNRKQYTIDDYKQLDEFYKGRTQQIHIVGEYANMMVRDYESALTFVNDYFRMDYNLFLTKYFKGRRGEEIKRNITPAKYQQLFEHLSERQAQIINDDSSKIIVTAAGPGSGKTKILVHKLASLILLEDVKQEQLLMLTFSRAAALEFRKRLVELIGNPAYYVEIKTFHSYCFDLLGRIGNLEHAENVVRDAAQMIQDGSVEMDRITKTVLVLDEAQDMNEDEYNLICTLMQRNDEMRVIAVGDDDQNIYEFRGSDSKYLSAFLTVPDSKKYELTQNFRSSRQIISFANLFVRQIADRMKTENIQPVKKEPGEVNLIRTNSPAEITAVEYLASAFSNTARKSSDTKPSGTIAVLTSTNEQAYLAVELLTRKGFRAKLLQSNEGFSLYDLAEIRCFLTKISQDREPVISDEKWAAAVKHLKDAYQRSRLLPDCLHLLEQFFAGNEKKYLTDLEDFLYEAKFSDFYKSHENEVCVSTIHKSKGHEFDHVFIALHPSSNNTNPNAELRAVYVGITRAKSSLCVFYNQDYFGGIASGLKNIGIQEHYAPTAFPGTGEIIMPLTHRDIFLSYSESSRRSQIIDNLRSGDDLQMQEKTNDGLKLFFAVSDRDTLYPVACASKEFCKKMQRYIQKGYILSHAEVLYVLKWRNKETGSEHSILLPLVRLKRKL